MRDLVDEFEDEFEDQQRDMEKDQEEWLKTTPNIDDFTNPFLSQNPSPSTMANTDIPTLSSPSTNASTSSPSSSTTVISPEREKEIQKHRNIGIALIVSSVLMTIVDIVIGVVLLLPVCKNEPEKPVGGVVLQSVVYNEFCLICLKTFIHL